MTDWIMIAITAVYVIATIFICIFNYRSAKATREQLAESKRQFEENNRAFVTVTFETIRGSLLVLNIHNHGHQVANNVSVKINPEFIANVPDKEYLVKLCESSFTLGVDKSWFVCFGGTPELGKISNIPLKITICYSDIFSTYSESTTIDLKQYLWSIIYDSPTEDTYQEMKKMTKSIQSMDKSIQKLQKRMLLIRIEEKYRMSEQTSAIVSKVWGMCNPLRDDGVSYGDYLEQLTYLIFLKMSDEYSKPPYKKETGIPAGYTWSDMNTLKGAELEEQYKSTLEELGKQGGILGKIFKGASNKISSAAILYRVVQMIDNEKWVAMSSDVKGEIYEGLLQKNAEDIKSGAGQYFTPRPLIHAMVKCIRPEPMKTIADPCCGSGGFFLASQSFVADPENYSLDREQKEFLKNETFYGNEIVSSTYKTALMNLYLHNIGDIYGNVPITLGDALLTDPGYRVDYVLTNPPFGKKSALTFTNEEGEQEEEDLVYNRQDFWTTSSNKQLNFVQHINTILKATGKAAVVVPDNVLFEGGAGEIVRKKLLETTDLHTILRLPTGIFYKPGVKANVIFFDKRPASAEMQTKEVWIYDFRTNIHFTLKQHPMTDADLVDFIQCYNPENRHDRTETWSEENPDGRFRRFDVKDILERDKTSLDLFWIKDKSLADLDSLPAPDELAADIIENLQSALESFQELQAQLGK